jgi:hypothetical protein
VALALVGASVKLVKALLPMGKNKCLE